MPTQKLRLNKGLKMAYFTAAQEKPPMEVFRDLIGAKLIDVSNSSGDGINSPLYTRKIRVKKGRKVFWFWCTGFHVTHGKKYVLFFTSEDWKVILHLTGSK